jgi:hypothetical protein
VKKIVKKPKSNTKRFHMEQQNSQERKKRKERKKERKTNNTSQEIGNKRKGGKKG